MRLLPRVLPSALVLMVAGSQLLPAADPPVRPPAPSGPEAEATTFPFEVSEKPLDIVLQWLSRKAGVNLVCNEADQPKVTMRLVNVTWQDVLNQISRKYDLVIEKRSDRIIELTRPPKVRMSFQDARLVLILEALARQAGLNIVISDRIDANRRLTMNLQAVPWRTALDVIVKTTGYMWLEQDYSIVRVVAPSDVQKELTTKVKRLNNSDGEKIISLVQVAMSTDGKIQHDPRTSSLVITDTPQNLKAVDDILTDLDVRTQEVQIEMRFVEFNNSDALKFGFSLNNLSFNIQNFGNLSSSFFPFSLRGSRGANAPSDSSLVSANMAFEATSILSSSEVIQTPTLLALNNELSKINVTIEKHFAESTTVLDTNGNPTVNLQEAKGSPVTSGIQIELTPNITSDGFVRIKLKASDSTADLKSITSSGQTIQLPEKRLKEVDTKIMVGDGSTAVIGGLLSNQAVENENRVPLLSRIPVLGYLFRQKENNQDQRNLTIFITPRIVPLTDKDDLEETKIRLREQLSGLKLKPETSQHQAIGD